MYRHEENFNRKKVLFVLRGMAEQVKGITGTYPGEFFFGYFQIKEKMGDACDYVVITDERLRSHLVRFLRIFEKIFSKITRLGFPLDVSLDFRQAVGKSQVVFAADEALGFVVLLYKLLGIIKGEVVIMVMSLPERVKYFKKNWLVIWIIRKLFAQADVVLTLSDYAQSDLGKYFLIPKTKMKTMYFGIDIDFWHPEPVPTESFILSIGNDMNRDYETLIDALPENMSLVLVTKKRIDTKGKNVKYLSGISHEELRTLYNRAVMVVVPSIMLKNESSGLSCTLQGMATRRPVIVSYSPPLAEMFTDGHDCLFYHPGDAQDLREKINRLLTQEDFRNKIADQGNVAVTTKYSLAAVKKVWNSIL